jgi:hypothetical protein
MTDQPYTPSLDEVARAEAVKPYAQMTEGERTTYWFNRAKAAEVKLEALHPWLMSGEYLSGSDLAETIKSIVWDEEVVSRPLSPATREAVALAIYEAREMDIDYPASDDPITLRMADAILAAFDIRERSEGHGVSR